jgi:NTP pyrophosphatase (non-canonical NTP hydrolase)
MGYPIYTNFNAEEFSRINELRCDKWHTGPEWDSMDWGGCIAGEAGEAQGFGKKIRRMDEGMVQKQVSDDRDALLEKFGKELADVVCYADLAATKAGLNLWEILKNKFNETSERNGFEERV